MSRTIALVLGGATIIPVITVAGQSTAQGALGISIGQAPAPPNGGTVPLKVLLQDTSDTNEHLVRFQLELQLGNASPEGVHFAGVQPITDIPVFPGVPFTDLGSDFDTILVSAELPPGQEADVRPGTNGLMTVLVEVPPGLSTSRTNYFITVGPNSGFFDASGATIPAGVDQVGGIFGEIPEPTGPTMVVISSALVALRHRPRRHTSVS